MGRGRASQISECGRGSGRSEGHSRGDPDSYHLDGSCRCPARRRCCACAGNVRHNHWHCAKCFHFRWCHNVRARAARWPLEDCRWPHIIPRSSLRPNPPTGTSHRVNGVGPSQCLRIVSVRCRAASSPHGTDCKSPGGLVALGFGAGPDTNRSAGRHSRVVFAACRDMGLGKVCKTPC